MKTEEICLNCCWRNRCEVILGTRNATDHCDWIPSRFCVGYYEFEDTDYKKPEQVNEGDSKIEYNKPGSEFWYNEGDRFVYIDDGLQ